MTVTSTVRTSPDYLGTGVEVTFSFAFRIFDPGDVVVQITDSTGYVTTLTSGYTVVMNADQGNFPGGSVTLLSPLASGSHLRMTSTLDLTQPVDITNSSRFNAEIIETALDRIVVLLQQQDVASAIRLPEIGGDGAITASPAQRLDRLLAFDPSTGAPVVTSFTQAQIASAIAAAYAAGSTADAVTFLPAGPSMAALSVQAFLRLGETFPEACGAIGDGVSRPLSNFFATLGAAQAIYGTAAGALTDEIDGVVIQAMIDNGLRIKGRMGATYLTSRGVWIKRGTHCEGAKRWAGVASTQQFTGTSTIKYVGPGGANSYVALLSTAAVGVAPGADPNLQNVVFKNWTLDGNDTAWYGEIDIRSFAGNDLDNITITRTRVCANVVIDGFVNSPRNRTAFLNRGAGFWLGRDLWSWGGSTTDDELSLQDWFAYFCGADPNTHATLNVFADSGTTYPTSANPDATCGFAVYGARALKFINVQAANNDGPGLYIAPSLHGPIVVDGAYFEFNSLSSGASRNWATWLNTNADGGSWAIELRDVAFQGTAPAHRITGTQSSRPQEGLRFTNCPIIGTVVADPAYTNWGMVNCDAAVTIVGGYPATSVFSVGGFSSEPSGPTFRYREGTFTPTLGGSTAAGTGWTYSIQGASYTRIGREVHVHGQILLTAKGTGATGTIRITNLPFTVQTGQGYSAAATCSRVLSMTTNVVSLTGMAVPGTTAMDLYLRTAAAASETAVALADLSNTTSFAFQLTYSTSDA